MKRMLNHIWLGTLPHCWSADEQCFVSQQLIFYQKSYPSEYKRKGRPLQDIKYWKAVEFLSFLLYSGPLILKRVLSREKYEHFLYFHAAIRILSSATIERNDLLKIEFAENCLRYFVDKLDRLYGSHHLVYNVHSLIHIADDCRNHGSLHASWRT